MPSEFKGFPLIVQYIGFNEYSLTEYIDYNGKVKEIKPTIFMKYVPGGNLENAINKKSKELYGDTNKLKIIIGIAAALSKIHQCLIIQRDIKPSNIVLDENFEPVICDFGSARQYSSLPDFSVQYTGRIGTPIYGT